MNALQPSALIKFSDPNSDPSSLTCSVEDELACPPGQFCTDGHCVCGVSPYNILVCRGAHSFKLRYYCATFNEQKNLTEMGRCFSPYLSNMSDLLYNQLPDDIHELTNMACNSMNRTGTLCGRCLPDHYPLAYSYSMACIRCPNIHWNWARYIMAAYLPLTIFCIVILLFNIDTTSSHLFAVVYYCQLMTIPSMLQDVFIQLDNSSSYAFSITLSFYAVWNLDFFRPFYSDICLGIGILPTLALEYAIAAYPLLLMIIFYLLVVLYDRNYRIIVMMWKPFRCFFSHFRKNLDARTSVIDAFATFFFLSNIKFLDTCSVLLYPTRVYQLYPSHYDSTLRLIYSPGVAYFGEEHLPQKFVSIFPGHWYILHTFVDSFHGCFKDGTEPGTRDYRWFAAVFFIFRLDVIWLPFVMDTIASSSIAVGILLLLTILTATLQPYKSYVSHYNVINVVFLLFLTLTMISFNGIVFSSQMSPQSFLFFFISCIVCAVLPLLYTIAVSCHWIYNRRNFRSSLALRCKVWRKNYWNHARQN